MSKKLAYERFIWFHKEVECDAYPNAATMARHFEVSIKTAQRDIEFMRDRLCAPLEYVAGKRGYCYTSEGFELPSLRLSRDELIALVMASRLATIIPDRQLKSRLTSFLSRYTQSLSAEININPLQIAEKVSIKNVEFYGVEEELFSTIIPALFGSHTINISYYSPHKDEETVRPIVPIHLLGYMGNWHVIAWCGMRKAMRNFALSRIRSITSSEAPLRLPDDFPPIKEYLRENFGIFNGGVSERVTLRFSPEASRWVREQRWHPRQETGWEDGCLSLTLPVSDFREIKREILRFGSDVEVLEPKSLREEVKGEIEKMKKIYR
ncbi:MAG: YafY family protein [bacterium]|nr:YafY family protein [bacterium]